MIVGAKDEGELGPSRREGRSQEGMMVGAKKEGELGPSRMERRGQKERD